MQQWIDKRKKIYHSFFNLYLILIEKNIYFGIIFFFVICNRVLFVIIKNIHICKYKKMSRILSWEKIVYWELKNFNLAIVIFLILFFYYSLFLYYFDYLKQILFLSFLTFCMQILLRKYSLSFSLSIHPEYDRYPLDARIIESLQLDNDCRRLSFAREKASEAYAPFPLSFSLSFPRQRALHNELNPRLQWPRFMAHRAFILVRALNSSCYRATRIERKRGREKDDNWHKWRTLRRNEA